MFLRKNVILSLLIFTYSGVNIGFVFVILALSSNQLRHSGHRHKSRISKLFAFEEKIIYWPYRLTVRTSAFQAGNPGSIPGRVTDLFLLTLKSLESLKAKDNFGVPLSISRYVGISSKTRPNNTC